MTPGHQYASAMPPVLDPVIKGIRTVEVQGSELLVSGLTLCRRVGHSEAPMSRAV